MKNIRIIIYEHNTNKSRDIFFIGLMLTALLINGYSMMYPVNFKVEFGNEMQKTVTIKKRGE